MKKRAYYSVLVALIVSIGGFLLGFDGTVNSGAVPFYKNTFDIADQPFLIGLSTGVIILGGFFGNLTAGFLNDKWGRRPSLFFTSFLFMAGALGTALAPNILLFIFFKLIAGYGVGIAILTAPVYISEIAPPDQRGRLVTFNQLNIVLGLTIAYFSNYYILQWVDDPELNWRWMLGVGFFPAVAYFGLLFFIPESPRWLIKKGYDQKAKTILEKIGGPALAEEEYDCIKKSIEDDENRKEGGLSEFFSKKMKLVLLIGFGIAFFQQVSGINAVLYYAPMIFQSTGGGQDAAFLQSIVVGLVFVGMTIISMFLIDRLGRKPLLVIGTSVMSISLLIASFGFYKATYTLNEESIMTIEYDLRSNIENAEKGISPIEKASLYAEVDLLVNTLKSIEDIEFDGELVFFNNIKSKLLSRGNKLKHHEGEAFYREIHHYMMDGMKQDAAIEKAVLSKYNSSYKSMILNKSISINDVLVLVGILGFIAGFSISLGPVTWAMLPEILPNRLRALGISIFGALNGITSFSVATMFPMELELLGASTTFLVFAIFMIICLIFSLTVVVETKGKSLEQVEKELIGEVVTSADEVVEEKIIIGH
ncbi:sugar porter family MFS transporter [Sediminitomix flava]|uniref:Sugar porter (SP) family MFS transporter n=1 Tax=Sediminitomix flava TaxID=379075 RepID=A0A315Z8L9_SEDFL|nr:sugar porter family MFS transporter [Sediminitomix flava]PWJ41915.1 sugar porter (SP) family MFS transporter [Sediminitomix flava]